MPGSLPRRVVRRLGRFQLFETLGHVWPFLKPEWRWLVMVAGVTVVLTVVEVAVPILVGVFVDSLLAGLGGREPEAADWLNGRNVIAMLAAGALLKGYATYQQRSLAGKVGQRVAARMRDALWAHLQKLPLTYTRRRGPGRLLMRFISDARAVQRLVSRGIVQLVQDVLVVAGVLAVLLYLDLYMGLAVVLMVPAIAGIFRVVNPRLQKASRKMRRRRSRLSAHLNVRITGLEVVKAYGGEEAEKERVEELNRRVADHGSRREAAGGVLIGASAGAVALITVLALALAAGEVTSGRLTAGELVTFYALVGLLAPIFQRITITDRTLQEAEISVKRLSETLAEQPESPREDLPPLEVGEGEVSVEDVSFEYPDGTQALDGVSLVARRGELVVITGPSGAGKSTLLETLPRFLEPTGGRVVVDGQDVSRVSLESLRSRIGLVAQDTPLLDGTIAENVTYGARDGVNEELLQRATHLSGVDELVDSLPDGWDTEIKEGRRALSDGQRQKVALARVLVADPAIILFDQAMSAMDDGTVRTLVGRLRKLAPEKTLIAATNRLPALLAADRIYALHEGRALEVSAEAAREHHENGHGDFTPVPGSSDGARRPVPTMPKRRRETDEDDYEEDDE